MKVTYKVNCSTEINQLVANNSYKCLQQHMVFEVDPFITKLVTSPAGGIKMRILRSLTTIASESYLF